MSVKPRKRNKKITRKTNSWLAIFLTCANLTLFSLCLPSITYSELSINKETLEDGVEHWYREEKTNEKPRFFKLAENIFEIILPSSDKLPFGKSVAFLVGVSKYDNLQPLPFVKNDLKQLRDFLLKKGGFDEVYAAADQTVTAELVQEYMFEQFPSKLGKRDRFLFYYSGHGTDLGVDTGYMQFSKAKLGKYTHEQVLPIDECESWSKRLIASHVLFIFDCCASGLAFTAKSGKSNPSAEILSTLSGNGSRTVITAGTANEKTFGVENQSIFTKAFLDALQRPQNKQGFITIDQAFAQLHLNVKKFAMKKNKKLTPRRWVLEEDKYGGTN